MFPWHVEQYQTLWRAKQAQRLPHALLFTGINGVGKTAFAESFTQGLLCSQPDLQGKTCDACHSCRLVQGRVHPNILWIEPEKEGHAIKVDQVRAVSEFINQTSLQGEYRAVLLRPAEAMNTNAANALLKSLEEPSSGAIIILLSDQGDRLPATILSRCQRIVFPRPPQDQALTWLKQHMKQAEYDPQVLLQLADGAPLAALRLVNEDVLAIRKDIFQALTTLAKKDESLVKLAANLQEIEPKCFLDFTLTWIMDVVRLQLGGGKEEIVNQDYHQALEAMTTKSAVEKNISLMNFLQQLRRQLSTGINFNKQLLIESVLSKWMAIVCSS